MKISASVEALRTLPMLLVFLSLPPTRVGATANANTIASLERTVAMQRREIESLKMQLRQLSTQPTTVVDVSDQEKDEKIQELTRAVQELRSGHSTVLARLPTEMRQDLAREVEKETADSCAAATPMQVMRGECQNQQGTSEGSASQLSQARPPSPGSFPPL